LEAQSHGIGLSFAGLLERFNPKAVLVFNGNTLNLVPGSVARVTFDKNDLSSAPEIWESFDSVLDITPFIPNGDDTANTAWRRRYDGPQYDNRRQPQPTHDRNDRKATVDDLA
jgi:hypothetical protein